MDVQESLESYLMEAYCKKSKIDIQVELLACPKETQHLCLEKELSRIHSCIDTSLELAQRVAKFKTFQDFLPLLKFFEGKS